jgi:hypothetical protein
MAKLERMLFAFFSDYPDNRPPNAPCGGYLPRRRRLATEKRRINHEGTKDTKDSRRKLFFFVPPSCPSCLRGLFSFRTTRLLPTSGVVFFFQERRIFFSEEKKQKTFALWCLP